MSFRKLVELFLKTIGASISHISPKMKGDLRLLHSTLVVILVLEASFTDGALGV